MPLLDWIGANWLSIVLTIVGLVFTWYAAWFFFKRQKEPRTLDYAIKSDQAIGFGADHVVPRNLRISWQEPVPREGWEEFFERELESPRIIRLHIRNTGKKPIDEDDFKDPITVAVDNGEILHLTVTEVSHEGIHKPGRVEGEGPERRLTPKLLNAGDWLELQAITEGSDGPPLVRCWMRGEARPMRHRRDLLGEPPGQALTRAFAAVFGNPDLRMNIIAVILAISFMVAMVVTL